MTVENEPCLCYAEAATIEPCSGCGEEYNSYNSITDEKHKHEIWKSH